MSGRTPTAADAAAIAALLRECSAAYGSLPLDADEVASWFAYPELEPDDFRVAEEAGRLVAYADLVVRAPSDVAWVDLRVPPHGALRPLLAWAEERARAKGAGRVRPMVAAAVDDEPLRRGAYAPIRRFFEMRIELDEEPARPRWPDGLTVRTLRPGEEERVHAAVEEAFADHWENEPLPFERWLANQQARGYDAALWFLVEADGELAAACLCSLRGDAGWVETLATRRPWRRRGLGAALLLHAFREFRRRGLARAGLDVDGENTTGAVRLYESVGMTRAYEQICWELPLS